MTKKPRHQQSATKAQAGFTLTELLVAVVIGLLILIIVSSSFILNQRLFRKSNLKAELTQNGRITLDLMSREIRQAKKVVTELPADDSNSETIAHELQFEDGHITSQIQYIRYYLSDSDLNRQTIVYFFDTEPDTYVHWDDIDPFGQPSQLVLEDKIIGENFDVVNFFGLDNINIELQLTKRGEQVEMRSIINPRNH